MNNMFNYEKTLVFFRFVVLFFCRLCFKNHCQNLLSITNQLNGTIATKSWTISLFNSMIFIYPISLSNFHYTVQMVSQIIHLLLNTITKVLIPLKAKEDCKEDCVHIIGTKFPYSGRIQMCSSEHGLVHFQGTFCCIRESWKLCI